MTKGDLTQVQLRRLLEQIRKRRDYFNALLARMDTLKFKESDSYYRLCKRVRDDVQELWLTTNYLANGKHKVR